MYGDEEHILRRVPSMRFLFIFFANVFPFHESLIEDKSTRCMDAITEHRLLSKPHHTSHTSLFSHAAHQHSHIVMQ